MSSFFRKLFYDFIANGIFLMRLS